MSETTGMTNREQFTGASTLYPGQVQTAVASQPQLDHDMRMGYTTDGITATYRPMGSPPPFQSISGGATTQVVNSSASEQKRKRGRPRKYGVDGGVGVVASGQQPIDVAMQQSQTFPQQAAPPPMLQQDSQMPLGGSASPTSKKARGRPPGSKNKKRRAEALGSTGIGFVPHVINVMAGEDVSSKIMAFSQNGPRAVCILSCSGVISDVTLHQAATSGGTATYQGRFDILSLSGSFLLSEISGQKSRIGGLSITLSGSDGRVFGGCVAGLLIAASPVQVIKAFQDLDLQNVIVGSFLSDGRKDLKSSNHMDSLFALPKANLCGASAANSSPSRGTLSESSGGPASPLNLSSGGCNINNNLQGISGMPWK
ncbi:DNA-binding protein ESCAROLA [Dorcoceras hygrometricum]|uniref:AT-hook motif nuclear-localized protein n=1 Tax=Dorcoceras hygrometricum TaxID=472368 RepID=A0A2Z7BSN3_9LAMI|nr:DNA-binding protein ESCAROLA [Dorcoceras hygrometricum]